MRDQRATLHQFGDSCGGVRLLHRSFRSRRDQRRFQRFDVIWQSGKVGVHESHGITKSAV